VTVAVPPLRARTHPVQVVAHRGSSVEAPEHTLAAYQRAVDEGADALECDVRLTADGYLVCVHDRRVDRTSDGRGVVSTLELAQLDELDFGAWHDGLDPQADPHLGDRRRLLTLERLLELVADAGRPLELAVETKHPTRYAGLVERRLIEMLDRFGWAHPRLGGATPVRVMSFSWLSLRRARALAPRVSTVYLMERVPLRFRDGSLPAGVHIAGPSIEIIRAHPGYVSRLKAHGHQVHVWTVDEEEDVTRCLDLGVDAVITNRPAEVLRRLTP
jgi:glycerophosphoryl diester phosphodiesterase